MATDPYPAIRREVERLLACHFYDADERSAAIAALNSRVEELCGCAYIGGRLSCECEQPTVIGPEAKEDVNALLSEEPGDD